MLLNEFTLVPLVVGDAAVETVAEMLEVLWGGPETLIVVSSDLIHYLDYDAAKAGDQIGHLTLTPCLFVTPCLWGRRIGLGLAARCTVSLDSCSSISWGRNNDNKHPANRHDDFTCRMCTRRSASN